MSAAAPSARFARAGHVLVAGVGGIGCPAAWALADAGVERLTLLDPDVVEPSNLPRQVLFGPEDVGRPKAVVAAERLRGHPSPWIEGAAERLDDGSAARRLAGVDVVLDATDGARAKDWIHAAAVRRGIPVVHAAGVGSEGRLLDVAPGGRPCLACLFGRLEREQGTCADLGVWNGVVGVVGFLAAGLALGRLEARDEPSGPYEVLDFGLGRRLRLAVAPDPRCPVCAPDAPRAAEPYPEAAGCDAPAPGAPPPPGGRSLDLRDEECPLNLLRARRAVEEAGAGEGLEILLNEEGARTVPAGLERLGHRILRREPLGTGLRLVVRAGPRGAAALDAAALRRYARQVVLPEVGEEGQRRVLAARVRLAGRGDPLNVAATYLRAAGVGAVEVRPLAARDAPLACAEIAGGPTLATGAFEDGVGVAAGPAAPALAPRTGPLAMALGALLADGVLREIVLGARPGARIRLGQGTSRP